MRVNSTKIKAQRGVSLVTLLLLISFAGCSDNSKSDEQSSSAKTDAQPVIEVVKNENAQEIKVALKESDKNQSESYYYDYNIRNAEPANKDASVREKPRTTIDANMNIRSPYEKVKISMMVKKLSKDFILKCSACHNDYANGVIGPSLLGKDSDYIFSKIKEFKSGKKTNVLMNDLIKMMDDKQIREMADDIHRFNQEIKKMRD